MSTEPDTTSKTAPSRVVWREGRLKQELVNVTIDLLMEPREIRFPTMREISQNAGVAPGAAYRHFDSQLDLLLAVVTEIFGRLELSLSAAAEKGVGPEGKIREISHAYVEWGMANSGCYQLLFETTDDPISHQEANRPGLGLIQHLALLVAQHFTSTEPQVEKATQLWVYMHGIVTLRTHKTGMPWQSNVYDEVSRFVDLILEMTSE
jgi:AcrR family transcriptional regulator